MKQSYKVAFVCVFLFIIYSVPGFQTLYEYAWQKDGQGKAYHHIQILDLPEDIFITPLKKANVDADTLRSLLGCLDSLSTALHAVSIDSTGQWDSYNTERFLDDAIIKNNLLKTSVLDYNRHVKGAGNPFAGEDTVRPYFRMLRSLGHDLNEISSLLKSGEPPATIAVKADSVKDHAGLLRPFANRKDISDYPGLVFTALKRTMIGADYLRPYEKEMEKSSIFANNIRPNFLFTYYTLFGDLGDKGIQGKQSWLFYRPDADYLIKPSVFDMRSRIVDPNDAPIRDSIIDTIVSFKKQLADKGVDLLLVIMPGKPSIYPDLLSPAVKSEMAGSITHSLEIMRKLNKAGIETVNLFSAFAKERANDAAAGDSIYLHTDTHFRGRAVLATAKMIADRIKQYSWYTPGNAEYGVDTLMVQRSGDIAEMTKLTATNIRMLKLSFPAEATKCFQVYQIQRDETGAETGRTLYRDDYSHSQILVLGDSFSRIYQTDEPKSAGWISHLALNLSQPVGSIVNDGGASTLVREMLARKLNVLHGKKLVVWEIVERDFRFGDKGWKDIKLVAAAE
jgi:hypothetical protein